MKEGLFGVVGGFRLGGKTTLAGTLPGKTVLLYADVLETGYKTAVKLANKNGNEVIPKSFKTLEELVTLLMEAADSDCDNIYIDSISAVTEIKLEQPEVAKIAKRNVWDAFRELGGAVRKLLKAAKGIATERGKNVFITMAYKSTLDASGSITKVDVDCKGNVTTAEIQRLCPIVVAVDTVWDDEGNKTRVLRTSSTDVIPARVDELLDEDNPGTIPADLSKLIELLEG